MSKEIKVLFVDDDDDDFFLVKKNLSKIERVDFILERSKTYADAKKKILKNAHDVYLIDYGLGMKNGLDLLKEMPEICLEKPVIFLTGQKNNNIDIQAMELGATDYIIKGNNDPLLLERSIRYAIERKKLERKIRNEKAIKDLLVDSTAAGICMTEAFTDNILVVNKSFLKMYGLNEEGIIGEKFKELFRIRKYSDLLYNVDFAEDHLCDPTKCQCLKGPIECRVIYRDSGAYKDCLLSCNSTILKNGKDRMLRIITMIDSTKQKEAERKLVEITDDLQEKIKEFGIETENPKAILSLIDVEVKKMNNIEELTEEWTGC